MPWTRFMDMHSGGGKKEDAAYIYIEAPLEEAKLVFYNRFGHSPDRVSCTCCGEDYSVYESPSLRRATGYDRGCQNIEAPEDGKGRYKKVDDPWFHEHYYLEPEEEEEAVRRGYGVSQWNHHTYIPLETYLKSEEVIIVHEEDIKPEERVGILPQQGYVWVD